MNAINQYILRSVLSVHILHHIVKIINVPTA